MAVLARPISIWTYPSVFIYELVASDTVRLTRVLCREGVATSIVFVGGDFLQMGRVYATMVLTFIPYKAELVFGVAHMVQVILVVNYADDLRVYPAVCSVSLAIGCVERSITARCSSATRPRPAGIGSTRHINLGPEPV